MSLTSITKDFFVKSGLTVLGSSTVTTSTGNTQTLQVNGGAAIAKNLIVGTTTEVYGITSLYGGLSVTNQTTLSNLVNITDTTNSTLTNTGALVVAGGVGVGQDLRVGGIIFGTLAANVNTASQLVVIERAVPADYYLTFVDSNNVISASENFYTSSTIYFNPETGLKISNAVNSTSTISGSLVLTGGAGIGQNLYVGGGTSIIGPTTVTNTINATSTITGALQVAGGVGIGQNLYVGGTIFGNVSGSLTGNVTGVSTTATNLEGGTTGSIPYQTAAGTTAFIPIGTNGFLLKSNGTTATWAGLGDLTVGNATTASNLQGGDQFQIPYQTGAGATAFESGFEYWYTTDTLSATNVLVAGTTNATSTNSGALQVIGGVGVGGNIYANGNLFVNSGTFIKNASGEGQASIQGEIIQGIFGQLTNFFYSHAESQYLLVPPNDNELNALTTVWFGRRYNTNLSQWRGAKNFNIGYSGSEVSEAATVFTIYSDNVKINSAFLSSNTQTGALVVNGGVGIGQNLYVGGGTEVAGLTTITNTTNATNTQSGALRIAGGLGVGGDLFVSRIRTAVTTNATTTQTGEIIVQGGIGVGQDVVVGGIIKTTGAVNATNTTTGDVQVAGGVGIGQNLYVGGTAASTLTVTANAVYIKGGLGVEESLFVKGQTVFQNDVAFLGETVYVFNTNTIYTDNIIELHYHEGTSSWTVNDLQDIGFRFHAYSNNTNTNSFLGRINNTEYLEWFGSGVDESNTGTVVGGIYGTFKTGSIILTDTTASNSTQTGALTVAGGVGIGQDLRVGGTIYGPLVGNVTGTASTASNLAGGALGSIPYQTGDGQTAFIPIGINGQVLRSNGTTATWVVLSDLSVGSAFTATNIQGGDQFQIPFQSGIGSTSFESGFEYWYTTDTLSATNVLVAGTTNATSTNTGALQVRGGAGIGQNLYVGGGGQFTGRFTATNIFDALNTVNITTTTDATSTISAALVVTGGVGIGKKLFVGGTSQLQGITTVTNTTDATSTTTASLVVIGGAGVGQSLYVGGRSVLIGLTTVTNTTNSVSTQTGAFVVGGGVGIGQAVNIGGTLSVTGIASFLDNTNATTTNDGSVRLTGGASIVKDVVVGGLITAGATAAASANTVVPAIFFNNTLLSSFSSNAITSLAAQNLDSFSASTYRSARYFNQVTSGTWIHISEISVFHDGTKSYVNEYGIATNNGTLGTFDATYSGGNVTLTFTPSSTSSMIVKLTRMAITV